VAFTPNIHQPELENLINGMLNKAKLLDLVRHFEVFEKSKKEDSKTGVIRICMV
jgi:type I restriction enzyme R subunit